MNIEIEEQAKEEMIKQLNNNEDETNGFVIVNEQLQVKNDKNISNNESIDPLLNEISIMNHSINDKKKLFFNFYWQNKIF